MPQSRAVLAFYSSDPPAIDAFHAFDPESRVAISAINDGLVYIDLEGHVQPALATAWRPVSPVEWEFDLRRGVRFHDGSPFDAESVVATFEAHLDPTARSPLGRGVLRSIKGVRAMDPFRVRIETESPDAMFIRRLYFSQIYPASMLRSAGRDVFLAHPVGTGPYRLRHYRRGEEIALDRFRDHWAGSAVVDEIVMPIVRQKTWVDALQRGAIDAALGIDAHDMLRLRGVPGIRTVSRPAAVSQWFLLRNRGPLSDVRVRRALNHAIHRGLICEIATHGLGSPQRSVATSQQEGFADDIPPYTYAPDRARRLLQEAGHAAGFKLQGLVSETSSAVFHAVREFLSAVGVELEAEVVPRGEWMRRVVLARARGGPQFEGDFALSNVDNPTLDSLFHQFIFLFSQGQFSLTSDPEFDKRYLEAAGCVDTARGLSLRQELERFVRDEAYLLFTVQQNVNAAMREGVHVPVAVSGSFNVPLFFGLRAGQPSPAAGVVPLTPATPDVATLLEATGHIGTFYMAPGARIDEPSLSAVWQNVRTAESRWNAQLSPMMRLLVAQAEARNNLANVMASTDRVGIVGYSHEGRQLFVNRGYERLVAPSSSPIAEVLGAKRWQEVRDGVESLGTWSGRVVSHVRAHEAGAATELMLTAGAARDDHGVSIGVTLVFTDFSGEEERIRTGAIRTILDNVPFALLRCDASGHVQAGYSASCARLFGHADIEGRTLQQLLQLDVRAAAHFAVAVEQIFDDLLPEELSLSVLPSRVQVGPRTMSISAAVVRGDSGAITSILFTLDDISALVAAERTQERARGVIQVLRSRSSFAAFLVEMKTEVSALLGAGAGDTPAWQAAARRALHTWKGVLAQFGMTELAAEIHAVEESPVIAPDDVARVWASMEAVLEENRQVWGLWAEAPPALSVSRSQMRAIVDAVRGAASLDQAREVVERLVTEAESARVGELFSPLLEAARAQAERRERKVTFALSGGDVRLRPAENRLLGAVTHVLRNAVDHGVEHPEDRGDKPAVASIDVGVVASADELTITVADDGRGIDGDALARRAVDKGLLDPQRASQMSPDERAALIFLPGLSTAAEVTDTSGRGVGMDAVRDVVTSLAGKIEVHTALGKGTRIVFDIPRRPQFGLSAEPCGRPHRATGAPQTGHGVGEASVHHPETSHDRGNQQKFPWLNGGT